MSLNKSFISEVQSLPGKVKLLQKVNQCASFAEKVARQNSFMKQAF